MSNERPLYLVALRAKRYVKARRNSDGSFEVTDWTVHGLSGGVVPPPTMAGRDSERRPNWTRSVAEHALARALAGGTPLLFPAPWDLGLSEPWPHLRRVQLATLEALRSVPTVLGCHPNSLVIEAMADRDLSPGATALWTLDPGTDLLEWESLPWFDQQGHCHLVTTGNGDSGAVRLERLANKAWRWAVPVPVEDPGVIDVVPWLIRRVGRGGAVIDAQLANPAARAEDHEVVYSKGDPIRFVADEVYRLGPTAFADRYGLPISTAEKIGSGRQPRSSTLHKVLVGLQAPDEPRMCALDGCDEAVWRPNQRYCTKAHKDRAYRARSGTSKLGSDKRTQLVDGEVVCSNCDTVLLGGARSGPCPACGHERREAS